MIKKTKIILLSSIALLIIWDILAVVFGGDKATISYVTFKASHDFVFLPYALGVLVGHFVGTRIIHNIPKLRYYIWIMTSIVVLVVAIADPPILDKIKPFSEIPCIFGYLIGWLFWTQKEIK